MEEVLTTAQIEARFQSEWVLIEGLVKRNTTKGEGDD
jgi:hypothetical protein